MKKMKFKVVNTIHVPGMDFGEGLLDATRATLTKVMARTEDELIRWATGADAVIGSGPVQPWTASVLNALSGCRIVASLGVGYGRIDLDAATDKGIVITNTPDYCIDEVSGLVVALILALGRKLFQVDRAVREKSANFVPMRRTDIADIVHPVFRMRDQTVGIVGMGRIGVAAALKIKGLGMNVIAYAPSVPDPVLLSLGVTPVDFNTLLRTSDFISINASLTKSSANMFGREEFRKMKPTCYLINTARGEIVDQQALVEALRENRIAGAGIDTTVDEPIAADDPLLEMPNVILTGHSAWYSTSSDSPEFWHKAMTQVIKALNGEWPLYAVNREVKRKWLQKWGKKS
jgi:D-3-phosphoglycerate dehydrogenase